jgi:hypothetical protein
MALLCSTCIYILSTIKGKQIKEFVMPPEKTYALKDLSKVQTGIKPGTSEVTSARSVLCATQPTLLEIRVLQGFFTNTYNKPYPKGFFTL